MNHKMEIVGKYWFTPGGHMSLVGVVAIVNEMGERKYYIGTSIGASEEEDAKYIAMYGAHFPESAGKMLIP